MKKYLLKRVLYAVVTLLIVSLIMFILTHCTGADPAQLILGLQATPESVAQLRAEMGLDRPLIIQYLSWLLDILRGDLGSSITKNTAVVELLSEAFMPTFNIAVFAEIISMCIGIPLGVLAAKYKGKSLSVAISSISLIGLSIPGFLLALFMMLAFCVKLQWFPVAGYISMAKGLADHIKSITLPAIALGIPQSALITRTTNSAMLEVLNTEYIKTAKAKGLSDSVILFKHALRNALIPIVTVCVQSFAVFFGSAIIVEQIFNIPGIGTLVYTSISGRDYYVIQGAILVIALVYVIANIFTDLLYGVVDPRVRITGKSK